jgi:hypothetical protein
MSSSTQVASVKTVYQSTDFQVAHFDTYANNYAFSQNFTKSVATAAGVPESDVAVVLQKAFVVFDVEFTGYVPEVVTQTAVAEMTRVDQSFVKVTEEITRRLREGRRLATKHIVEIAAPDDGDMVENAKSISASVSKSTLQTLMTTNNVGAVTITNNLMTQYRVLTETVIKTAQSPNSLSDSNFERAVATNLGGAYVKDTDAIPGTAVTTTVTTVEVAETNNHARSMFSPVCILTFFGILKLSTDSLYM